MKNGSTGDKDRKAEMTITIGVDLGGGAVVIALWAHRDKQWWRAV